MTQIRLEPDGLWHRRMAGNGGDRTACGLPIGVAFAIRDYELDMQICPACFTRPERDTGKIKKAQRDHGDEDRRLYYGDDEEPTDPNGEEPKSMVAIAVDVIRLIVAAAIAAVGLVFLFFPSPRSTA